MPSVLRVCSAYCTSSIARTAIRAIDRARGLRAEHAWASRSSHLKLERRDPGFVRQRGTASRSRCMLAFAAGIAGEKKPDTKSGFSTSEQQLVALRRLNVACLLA